MKYYDDNLKEMQEKIARKRQLSVQIENLCLQKKQLINKVSELEKVKIKEEYDVEKLERSSLANLFYNVFGKMNEKLEKEEEEAHLASVKYDVAMRELYSIEKDLECKVAELSRLSDCEYRFQEALNAKSVAIKSMGGELATNIFEIEEKIVELESNKKELQEAVLAGQAALKTAQAVLSDLNDAEGWSTFDLLGGGLLSDLAKHSHLDKAQGMIEHLQIQLGKFRTELADVEIEADWHVNVDGFMRFADYFFDGLVADWMVMDKINQSQNHIRNTMSQISDTLSKLYTMEESTNMEQEVCRKKLDELIVNSEVQE